MTQESAPPPMNPSPAPVGYQGPEPDKDAKTMAMLCHLLAIFTGFIGPLVVWLIKKDSSPFVDDQGKEALNFQITMFIAFIVAGISTCIFIGFFLIPVLVIANLVFCILATMKANQGVAYRYPVALRLIK
ncbi:MAG TPA: DUF4870 domain-containing protein [Tepidisphaeraceae bacterium]|nr:DUF4870 domain-containing protein [Tepidisphaeraceae bacterium]